MAIASFRIWICPTPLNDTGQTSNALRSEFHYISYKLRRKILLLSYHFGVPKHDCLGSKTLEPLAKQPFQFSKALLFPKHRPGWDHFQYQELHVPGTAAPLTIGPAVKSCLYPPSLFPNGSCSSKDPYHLLLCIVPSSLSIMYLRILVQSKVQESSQPLCKSVVINRCLQSMCQKLKFPLSQELRLHNKLFFKNTVCFLS